MADKRPNCRISRLLVALPAVLDLLLFAKHLFVEAMVVAACQMPLSELAEMDTEQPTFCGEG